MTMDTSRNSFEDDKSKGVKLNLNKEFDACESDNDEVTGNLKVFCRVRPMLKSEEEKNYQRCVCVPDKQHVRAVVPLSSAKFKNTSHTGQNLAEDFEYTMSFGPEIGQFSFFLDTMMNTMSGFIDGQNELVFSYGITNSGKTYTLQGNDSNPGLIPLGLNLFFASIQHQLYNDIVVKPERHADFIELTEKQKASERELKNYLLKASEHDSVSKSINSSNSIGNILCQTFYDDFKAPEMNLSAEDMEAAQTAELIRDISRKSADRQVGKCNIWISFVEIYNEYIYDLLQHNKDILNRPKLDLKDDQNGEVYVKGATEVCVSNSEEAIKLLHLGQKNLKIASTKLNYQSSRSHCIFTIKVVRIIDEKQKIGRVNRLAFCDLAGSERAGKAETRGIRLKEASYINNSLLVLGRCLEQLRLNQTSKEKMIPFRESKLTRLFSGYFIGKGRAVMIANASPCEYTFDETLNVLRFSALAKELILKDEFVSKAASSLQDMALQMERYKSMDDSDASLDVSAFIEEKDDIIRQLHDLALELNEKLEKEKKEKIQIEYTLRQEICKEFSEDQDRLIADQQKIADDRVEGLRNLYEARLKEQDQQYMKKIAELQAELAEYEDSDEESLNESKTMDDTAEKSSTKEKSFKGRKSSLSRRKQSEDLFGSLSQQDIGDLQNQNKTLQLEMDTIRNELEVSNKQLEQYSAIISSLKKDKVELEKLNNNLSAKMAEAEQSCEKYLREINDEKEKSSGLQNLCDKIKSENEELASQMATLPGQHVLDEQLQEEIKKFNEKELELANVKIEYKNKMSTLKDAHHALKEEHTVLTDKCESFKSENECLKIKLEEAQEMMNNMEKDMNAKLASAVDDKNSDFAEQRRLKEELEEAVHSLKEKHEALVQEISTLTDKYESLVEENERLTKLAAEADHLKKLSQEEISALKAEILDVKTKLSAANSTMEEKVDEIELEKQTLSADYEKLQNEFAAQVKECDEVRADCDQVRTTIKLLEGQISEMAEKSQEMEELRHKEIGSLKAEVKQQAEELAVLRTELEQSNETKALEKTQQVEDLLGKLQSLKEENEQQKAVIEDLRSKCDELKNKLRTSTDKEDQELRSLREELEEKTKVIKDLKAKCDELQSELAENNQADEVTSLKEKLDQKEKEIVELQGRCQDNSRELEELQAQNADDLKEVDELRAFIKENSRELEELQAQNADRLKEVEELRSLCKEYNRELEELRPITAQNAANLKEIDELKIKCEDLSRQSAEKGRQSDNMFEKLESLQAENERKTEEISDLQTRCDNLINQVRASGEKDKLEGELRECRVVAMENYKAEIVQLKKKLAKSEEELATAFQLLSNAESEKEEHTEEKEQMNHQLTKMNTFKAELEIKEQTIKDLNEEIEKLVAEVEAVTKALNDKESTVSTLQSESKIHEETVEKLHLTVVELREKLSHAEEEIATLNEKLEHRKTEKTDEVEDLLAEIETATKALEDKESELSSLQSESKLKQETIEKLNDTIDELRENLSNAKEEMDALNKDLEEVTSTKKQLEECQSASQLQIQKYEKSVKSLESKTESYKSELQSVKKTNKDLEETVHKLQKDMHHVEKFTDELMQVFDEELDSEVSLKTCLKDSLVKVKDLQRQVVEKGNSIEELERALCDAQKMRTEAIPEANAKISTGSSRGGHKRKSSSPAPVETEEVVKNKENASENVGKRRRVTRKTAPKAYVETDSDEEKDTSIYKPTPTKAKSSKASSSRSKKETKAKTTKTSRSKKEPETSEKPANSAKTTTRRNKLTEQNPTPLSPVQKGIEFMRTKLQKMVAPSPRVTRGQKKKLFDNDAAPAWKL